MVTTNAVREHPIEPGLDGSDIDDTGIRDRGWDDSYWGPGDPDFGTATPPHFTFADPHAAGLFHADDEHVSIHNRGTGPMAALIFLDDGRVELRRLGPGETITLPDEDSFTYLQAPRGDDGRPVIYGGVWVHQGRAMPVTIPIPSEREFLAQRYLTPWSTDWAGGTRRLPAAGPRGGSHLLPIPLRRNDIHGPQCRRHLGCGRSSGRVGVHRRRMRSARARRLLDLPALRSQRRLFGGGPATRRLTRTRTLCLGVGHGAPRLGGAPGSCDGLRLGGDHGRVADVQRAAQTEPVSRVLGSTTLRPHSSVRGSRVSADPARCSTDVASELGRQTGDEVAVGVDALLDVGQVAVGDQTVEALRPAGAAAGLGLDDDVGRQLP
ncbi:hypothetical protein BPODLACK_02075 [Gordonia sp. YY1]|nr:hypothetical protein BPODLACK_02075 [Gordonia sp. YY1]